MICVLQSVNEQSIRSGIKKLILYPAADSQFLKRLTRMTVTWITSLEYRYLRISDQRKLMLRYTR